MADGLGLRDLEVIPIGVDLNSYQEIDKLITKGEQGLDIIKNTISFWQNLRDL